MRINHMSYKFSSLAIFCFILFFLNSFLSIVVFSICAIQKKDTFSHYFTWGFLFALFVSVVNASKVPTNDLAMYLDYYHQSKYLSFNQYIYILGNWGKDILYLAYTWILHLIIGDSDKIFVFAMSFTSYIFFLEALLIACKSLKLNTTSILLCFAVLFFHPYIFSTSAHILRQTIAFSITTYVLAKKIFEHKNLWYIGIIAALFHGSVLFFIPFLFFNILYQPITIKKVLIISLLAGSSISLKALLHQLQKTGLPVSFFDFALQRAIDGTTFDTTLDFKQILFSLFIILMMFSLMYIKNTSLKNITSFNFFLNLTAILFIFILINKESGELQLRFNIFLWQLHPFFAAFFLAAFNHIKSSTKILFTLLFFASWVIYNRLFSPWKYECGNFFWLYPAFMYFMP